MKIIYLTYNYHPCSQRGFDKSTNIFINYLIDLYGEDSIDLLNLNNNGVDVKKCCIESFDKSFRVSESFAEKKLNNTVFKMFSERTSKGRMFSSKNIVQKVKKIATSNTLNYKETSLKIIFNSIVGMEFFDRIKESINELGIKKVEYVYIAEDVKHSYYSSKEDKKSKSEKEKLLNIEKKLYELDKVICFSKKDQDYFQSLNKKVMTSKLIFPLSYPKSKFNSPDWSQKIMLISNNLIKESNLISLKWFLDKLYPLIDKEIKIVVTGKGDVSSLKNKYKGNINFTGSLTEELYQNLILKCALVFHPKIIGSGISNNIIEAMSYNCVTVSTSYGNHFSPYIVSSDNEQKLAKIINSYIKYGIIENEHLDYNLFFKTNFERFESYMNK